MNKMYPILKLINLYFYPTTNILHPIFLLILFNFIFTSVPQACEFGFATKCPNIVGVKSNKFMKLKLVTQS
jgi:hypothetical protein